MTDNIVLNPGFGGDVVAADDVNGVQHQLVKVEFGDADSAIQVSGENPLPVTTLTGSIPTTLFEHLKSGSMVEVTGSATATSGSPDYYSYAPASGEVVRISQLTMQMEISGAFGAGFYGDITGGLVNGLELQIMSGSDSDWTQIQNLSSAHPIQKNIDWGHFCYDIQFITTLNTGSEFALARWRFEDAGAPLRLDANNNEALVLIVRDDLSTLTSHQFSVQGIIETQLT